MLESLSGYEKKIVTTNRWVSSPWYLSLHPQNRCYSYWLIQIVHPHPWCPTNQSLPASMNCAEGNGGLCGCQPLINS